MKVRCIANTRQELLQTTLERLKDAIEERPPIKLGEIYIVFGQAIIKDVLNYLIIGTYENLPSWYPAELFEVVDHQVHFEWYYQFNANSPISALWGYHEMIFTDNHYDDLQERDDEAIRIFLKRKKEIDEFS